MINILIRDHLKEKCHEKKMTLVELSEKTGISRWQLTRKDKNFRLDTIGRILSVLECKFEDIFEIINISD